MAWKRLLAYSSLEHMGVIALGIGFGTPLALAGVAIHIAAHAVAKALGFYAATPLLGHDPRAAGHAVTGIARTQRSLGTTLGISLGTLAGLPPVAALRQRGADRRRGLPGRTRLGGNGRDRPARARVPRPRPCADRDDHRQRPPARPALAPGLRGVTALSAVSVVLLAALTLAGLWLPDTELVQALTEGIS